MSRTRLSTTDRALRLAVDALAAYRLTRLVTRDTVTVPWRDQLTWHLAHPDGSPATRRLADRYGPDVAAMGSLPGYLLACPWCAGLWIAAGVVGASRRWPLRWRPLAEALAVSAAVGLLAERE